MTSHFRAVIVAGIGCLLVGSSVFAAEQAALFGAVLKLSEVTDKPFSVNVGGLVVVIVRDSGSRPPQEIKVDAPAPEFEALGTVRGAQNDQGTALMGGGYTWYLFRPATAGEGEIRVSYLENGDGGKNVERVYKMTIEAKN